MSQSEPATASKLLKVLLVVCLGCALGWTIFVTQPISSKRFEDARKASSQAFDDLLAAEASGTSKDLHSLILECKSRHSETLLLQQYQSRANIQLLFFMVLLVLGIFDMLGYAMKKGK